VAFALPVGQVSAFPVRSAGAWFVVKAMGRRPQATPSFATIRGQIMQDMLRDAAPAVVRETLAGVVVREYSIAGREMVPETPAAP
jgi:parvulin-like peptidyl-prolyl isomerase